MKHGPRFTNRQSKRVLAYMIVKSVHENLRKRQYDYIGDLKDFEMDDELSTKDDLVLHNAKTGETVISYRGTTDDPVGKPKNFVDDWLVNGQIAGESDKVA